MKLNKVKEDKELLVIEVVGESIGFANLIKEELWKDKNLDEAAYVQEHPYMSEPKIYVKMKGKFNPRVALDKAVKGVQVDLKELKKEFEKSLKD